MKQTKTELVLLIDKSGSMASIKKGMEKALNDFITEQKALPGECNVSLIEFDDKYDVAFESRPLAQVGNIDINPRGGTALLDALGKTINTLDERLVNTTDENVPDVVCFVVVTDGEENSSKEYTGETIKKLLDEKTNALGWKFVYFGTNQDAIATATKFGFQAGNTISYATSAAGLAGTSFAMSSKMSAYRGGSDHSFSAMERSCAMGEDVSSVTNVLDSMKDANARDALIVAAEDIKVFQDKLARQQKDALDTTDTD